MERCNVQSVHDPVCILVQFRVRAGSADTAEDGVCGCELVSGCDIMDRSLGRAVLV